MANMVSIMSSENRFYWALRTALQDVKHYEDVLLSGLITRHTIALIEAEADLNELLYLSEEEYNRRFPTNRTSL
ncbi:hypothetical protein NVP2275O_180 [Vibrio phage 2.275.O._10N.286.54.E11]|nr:hypothetical protein NVP2275O_180 [Vibrio phage 2.275.O._10N.286.54.E11]